MTKERPEWPSYEETLEPKHEPDIYEVMDELFFICENNEFTIKDLCGEDGYTVYRGNGLSGCAPTILGALTNLLERSNRKKGRT